MKNRYGLASVTGSSAGLTGKWFELNDLPSHLKTKQNLVSWFKAL